MKPHVICLMASSVDGRTLPSRWRPKGAAGDIFERVHNELAGDAWLIGRVIGQEFAKGKSYPISTEETFPRVPWFARRDAKAYGVVLDTNGKIVWGRSDIGGDPIVVVLSEAVTDAAPPPPWPPLPPASANPMGRAAISRATAKLLGLQMIMTRSFQSIRNNVGLVKHRSAAGLSNQGKRFNCGLPCLGLPGFYPVLL